MAGVCVMEKIKPITAMKTIQMEGIVTKNTAAQPPAPSRLMKILPSPSIYQILLYGTQH